MELRARLAGASALALAVLAPAPAAAQAYRNPDLPVDQRAADLVRRMTITEKAAQMQNGAPGIERLGALPYDSWNETLHGVARAGEATVFPHADGMDDTIDHAPFPAAGQVSAHDGPAPYNQAQRHANT